MLELAASHPPSERFVDYCASGTMWRKRTRFWSWHLDLSHVGGNCRSCRGIFQYTGKKHIQLSGRHPSGKLWTAIAEPYPKPLCKDIAAAYISVLQNLLLDFMWAASRPDNP